jgi:hypothetical protein
MKRSTKATLLMILMALVGGTKGAAIEREGEIMFPGERRYFRINPRETGAGYLYLLDTTGDGIEDVEMNMVYAFMGGANVVDRLVRYLQPGTRIIYEDEGLRPNERFGAGRIIGFTMPNGQFVRLDQMFSQDMLRSYFPYLWAKMQAEQRASR